MRRHNKVLVRGPVVPAAVAAFFLLTAGTSCSAGKAGVPLLTGSTEPAVSFGSPKTGRHYKLVRNCSLDKNRPTYMPGMHNIPDHLNAYKINVNNIDRSDVFKRI